MKKAIFYSLAGISLLLTMASCNTSYDRTKSGLLYKIISGGSKDSSVQEGDWIKFTFQQKLNDSVVINTFGKMPAYVKIEPGMKDAANYHPSEIYPLLKKGDSVVIVALMDSLLRKGLMQPGQPGIKKSDRIIFSLKVMDVFRDDDTYQKDLAAETERDAPRQAKEREEETAKMQKQIKEMQEKEYAELEKSGEIEKGIKAMEAYLKSKNITATKVGKGTFVKVIEEGTGEFAGPGKYVTVKYSGRMISKDTTFDSGTLTRQLGMSQLISGMEEGLEAFKQGGKGVLYIPGFRAYGRNPQPGSPFGPFEPLIFDVEVLAVSDQPIQ